ncbi:MAG: hypothetical protein HOI23_04925 [Deltaproteobacteria bacterium]|jgi:hypothetical protein|nr:hypothetical protein [Deltaproteobacteria bacterium]
MDTREFLHELATPLSNRTITTTAMLALAAGTLFSGLAAGQHTVVQDPRIILPIGLAYLLAGIIVPLVAWLQSPDGSLVQRAYHGYLSCIVLEVLSASLFALISGFEAAMVVSSVYAALRVGQVFNMLRWLPDCRQYESIAVWVDPALTWLLNAFWIFYVVGFLGLYLWPQILLG